MLYTIYNLYTELGTAADYPSHDLITQNTTFSIPNYSDREFHHLFHPFKQFSVQGLIAFSENLDKCPLEIICNPFNFDNENQIIHIRSNYFKDQTRKIPCKWSFEAPEGYGFKVLVQKLDPLMVLRIENSTDIITK
uniref:Uncharacterized protein n=1 Tax=Panagrolaimus sp. PS1159 TaxID=55785 RepID=A0AC35G6E3_9BILA